MDISLFLPLLLVLLFIPLFLSGRKQRRQMSAMQELQKALEPGDVVMTTSGLRGTVVDASYEDTIDLEIAEGVVTTWVRAAVREKVALPDESVTPDEPAATNGAVAADAAPSLEKAPPVAAEQAEVTDALPDATAAPVLSKDDSANGSSARS